MNRDALIAFETRIAGLFNAGRIRHPVHLSDGNEDALIEVFRDVGPDDWICGSWRMHYQCLLKGVPPEVLEGAILAGRSMALCFPEYRIVSSAIVGGILPIATGIALGIRLSGGRERVHCFMGDMTAETGVAHECMKYAARQDLPVRWIVEDNGISVCTATGDAWGAGTASPDVLRYRYASRYPHAGAGVRVQF